MLLKFVLISILYIIVWKLHIKAFTDTNHWFVLREPKSEKEYDSLTAEWFNTDPKHKRYSNSMAVGIQVVYWIIVGMFLIVIGKCIFSDAYGWLYLIPLGIFMESIHVVSLSYNSIYNNRDKTGWPRDYDLKFDWDASMMYGAVSYLISCAVIVVLFVWAVPGLSEFSIKTGIGKTVHPTILQLITRLLIGLLFPLGAFIVYYVGIKQKPKFKDIKTDGVLFTIKYFSISVGVIIILATMFKIFVL